MRIFTVVGASYSAIIAAEKEIDCHYINYTIELYGNCSASVKILSLLNSQ